MDFQWDDIADVVVVGDGCAGAVTAICAREEGANVLVIEKQPKDSHFTCSVMSGGSLLLPRDKDAIKYLESLYQMPGGLSWIEPDIIRVYVEFV